MPSHPRVEEVEDSDLEMSDPSEGDIDDFAESDILVQRDAPPAYASKVMPGPSFTPLSAAHRAQAEKQHQQFQAAQAAQAAAAAQQRQVPPPQYSQQQQQRQYTQPPGYPQMQTTTDDSAYKSFQCLYPCYFDATRSRAEGRRVSKELAVPNPLATEIVNACAQLRLSVVLEAGKLHPKDWANPGRVKVNLKEFIRLHGENGKLKNKHHLYILVAEHLKKHPTTDESPALRVVVRGAGPPPREMLEEGKKWPRPAVPRGWKMSELLPYYSPAMTGGGVSENFLKDMMKEMGPGGMPGMPGMPGGGAGAGAGGMPDMASLLQGMGGMGGLGGLANMLGGMGGMGGSGATSPGASGSEAAGKKKGKGKK
ncbi:signal recognition particle sec65 subunit [Neurospora crassa OR74A]|uniref:Signal recognition particle sec65 subunit n=2 Tax=Neurospora crassa TaxID=5141 RepID=Q1K4M2_NEUCR|nr:signal recognition particle sec65 subunit [Neurospora crassa OR74A]EAA26541.1 signal recognition particle sec65 subunit [Neurospora crassa OR74A]CAD21103.1 related to signal recognition particle protein Sec65 [Neurospora crassa]|eukprot:XP_955777.1 signal recognition particle sec65 subunit [Neurospora crassa OR74A]